MKSISKFGLFVTALSLCVGSVVLSGNKAVAKVLADDGGLEFVMTNDSTCSDTMFYSKEGSDFQYLDWTTLNKTTPLISVSLVLPPTTTQLVKIPLIKCITIVIVRSLSTLVIKAPATWKQRRDML